VGAPKIRVHEGMSVVRGARPKKNEPLVWARALALRLRPYIAGRRPFLQASFRDSLAARDAALWLENLGGRCFVGEGVESGEELALIFQPAIRLVQRS
jgi:hypothetical protein